MRSRRPIKPAAKNELLLRMYLVPCSCGTTFTVSRDYDRQGPGWNRYLPCPKCCKRHDPKNRLLQIGYRSQGYWTVDEC